jgi:hypothetical protein
MPAGDQRRKGDGKAGKQEAMGHSARMTSGT